MIELNDKIFSEIKLFKFFLYLIRKILRIKFLTICQGIFVDVCQKHTRIDTSHCVII